ncbi:hypothetical protein G7Z17_g767 [Cylindrodendrum hubeiense]|uniref:Uncharacterized protein n=1 Tax=Cylindrodendrum hubeiense TaxID=595255 RepID=A0A9P5LFY6_9HYPO|nr:hypothetical protein G7Z17_g767 [Cylindrodendrum hubeiense]
MNQCAMSKKTFLDYPVPYTDEKSSDDSDLMDGKDESDATQDFTAGLNFRRPPSAFAMFIASVFFITVVVGPICWVGAGGGSGFDASSQQPERQTESTQQKQKTAFSYMLDLPALYPDITSEPKSECRAAWDTLAPLPCHVKLFDRGSDNSTWNSLRREHMRLLPWICKEDCQAALEDAHRQLSAKCSPADMFILDGYDGMFDTTWLESGPAAAVETLVRRKDHMCYSRPTGDSDPGYCSLEMRGRFNVIDGINMNLEAIDAFVKNTDYSRVERGHWYRDSRSTERYNLYQVREQVYGPEDGETSCGWCTFDFLNRTLNSWTEGAVINPESRQPISLPEFIRRVRVAGRRCAPTNNWQKIYDEAIARYNSAGVLPTGWETTLPSDDLHSLIKNGPSLGDSPVSDIAAEYDRLTSQKLSGSWDGSNSMLANTFSCLFTLAKHYTSAKCYINLSHDMLSEMIEDEELKDLREAYCGKRCSHVLDSWPSNECRSEHMTPKAHQFLDEYWMARRQRDLYCNLLGPKSDDSNCAQSLVSMNKTSWALTGRPETPIFLAELEKELNELKRKLGPVKVHAAFDENQKVLVSSDSESSERPSLENDIALGNSVCAGCIWNWLVSNDMSKTIEFMRGASSGSEYVDFVKKYHATCTSLGATWLGGVPYGDDPIIWRVKAEGGQILRYFKPPKGSMDEDTVFGGNDANGAVFTYSMHTATRPGFDIGSLWNVLQAERGLKAIEEGRFKAWKLGEEKYRREADKEVWEIDDYGAVRYIGFNK